MQKIAFFLFVSIFTLIQGVFAQKTDWNIDVSHSSIQFSVSHLLVSEVVGKFKKFKGSLNTESADFTGAFIEFAADVNSIDTDNEQRDAHLKSDDFFNAEKFPQIKFVSTSFKKKSGSKYELRGNLTIRDVTKPVTFTALYGGTHTDPWKNVKAGFKIVGKISRKEYGLRWNTLTEAGGAVVGDEVTFTCNIELGKVK